MATKKTKELVDAEVTASADTSNNSPFDALANELVAEAAIKVTADDDKVKKAKTLKTEYQSNGVTVMNTSYNEILLNGGRPELTIRIAPKEIKTIGREMYRELMKVQVVRNWFDKGILATSSDGNETSVHEAVVPENLKNPVERTDSVSTVSASVTKFQKDGSVKINL